MKKSIKTTLQKISVLFLLITILLSTFGCASEEQSKENLKDSSNEYSESTSESTLIESTEDITSSDSENISEDYSEDHEDAKIQNVSYSSLPKIDLNKREFHIIERWFGYGKDNWSFSGDVLYMEDENGTLDVFNQTKKDIISQVEKDYNCTIKGEIFGEGSNNIVRELQTLIISDVTATTGKYDFFFESSYYYSQYAREGYLKDIKNISTINLQSSCWDQNLIKDLSLCNSLYFLNGSIDTYDNDGTCVMLFNKSMFENSGYGSPEILYNMVKNHQWTFDALTLFSAGFNDGLDENSTFKEIYAPSRNWFMASDYPNIYTHLVSSGEKSVIKNQNDEPVVVTDVSKTSAILSSLVDFYKSKNVLLERHTYYINMFPIPELGQMGLSLNAFKEGRALFYMTNMTELPEYRNMKDEFGILPLPMYDSLQKDYISPVSARTSSSLMIPNSHKANNNLGIIIQALCELSEEKLTPAYYDKILYQNGKRDNDSEEMLDIIFQNRTIDLGEVFYSQWMNVTSYYTPSCLTNDKFPIDFIINIENIDFKEIEKLVNNTISDIKQAQKNQ